MDPSLYLFVPQLVGMKTNLEWTHMEKQCDKQEGRKEGRKKHREANWSNLGRL